MKNLLLVGGLALCGLVLGIERAPGQGAAFSYQGRLLDNGQPAAGVYDLTFALYDAATNGARLGAMLTNSAVGITNGLFLAALDFGNNFPGADRWLEIAVRPAGAGAFSVLASRQKLTPTPYSVTAANLSGNLSAAQVIGVVAPAQSGSFTNHSDVAIAALVAGDTMIYGGGVWTNSPRGSAGPAPSNSIPVALVYSGTNVLVNAALGTHFRLVATNDFLMQNPTGASDAQRLLFEIIQDGTGGRRMTLGGAFRLGTDIPFVNLTTNAGRRDFLTCVSSGTNFFVVGFLKGY